MGSTAWMPHPSGLTGNSAVALISRDGADNNDFDGLMQVTPHLDRTPYTQQVMASFNEVLARSRFMKLDAGAEVSNHVDFNYHWYSRVRIHIPITTNPAVVFYCGDQQVHMRAGECWIFDSWRRHNVINRSQENRVHLVIDTSGSSRFWHMVRAAEQSDNGSVPLPEPLQYQPGIAPKLFTEHYNVAPVMSPGELDAIVQELIIDFQACGKNATELVVGYAQLLRDFAKDWRELWHLHAYQKEGWPHYRSLIENVKKQLHPEQRALVTASNDIGVNPIIMQRILNVALSVDQYDAFTKG